NILIAEKKAGVLVHSDNNEDVNTLINHIKAYLYTKGEYDPKSENSFAPSLCNRIDRNTAGLVIAAKNAVSLRIMNDIIKNREVEKIYLAACHGMFKQKSGELVSFLEKDSRENKVYAKKSPSANTKTAISEYRVIEEEKSLDLSLVEVTLKTGRTHQIRAQMAECGHPLLGDGKYAINKDDKKIGYKAQALCSYSLTFCFKTDKGELQYLNGRTVKAEKPDFLNIFR
ncbi:MAG: RNA pseudouridine synthase, partial [Clostridia bacterium]